MKGCICQFAQWDVHPFVSKWLFITSSEVYISYYNVYDNVERLRKRNLYAPRGVEKTEHVLCKVG